MNKSRVRYFALSLALFAPLLALAQSPAIPKGSDNMKFQLSTPSFPPEQNIPRKFTCDGADVAPALSWNSAPSGTKSFALIVDDPDAPAGTWTHWLLWNIPPSSHDLPEGVPKDSQLPNGARQGRNDFGKIGYNGPIVTCSRCSPSTHPSRSSPEPHARSWKLRYRAIFWARLN
jgi:phosphatidylethanolamine-binding protein (PEBP) family uncharacterized protein